MRKKRSKRDFGKRGEDIAEEFLRKKGYLIITRNYQNFLGEIDIIAKKNNTLCFIEVKAREGTLFGSPLAAVTKQKQIKLGRLAAYYLMENHLEDQDCRFDVVSILFDSNQLKTIEIIEDAFDLS